MNPLLNLFDEPESPSNTEAWQLWSVQKFFSSFNWENDTPAVQEFKQLDNWDNAVPLSLSLTVAQFFAAFNWDGAVIAAAPSTPQVLAQPAPKNDLTLDDFSSLF
jgi:hypothetical protein